MPRRVERETEAERRARETAAAQAEYERRQQEATAAQTALGGDGSPMSREEYDRLARTQMDTGYAAYQSQMDAERAAAAQQQAENGLDDPWLSERSGGSGGGGYGGYGSGGLSYGENAASYIPVVGNLSGLAGQRQRYEDMTEAERNRQVWRDLAGTAPSVDALTPDTYLESNTDEYGNLIGGPSQLEGFGPSQDQNASLAALRSMYESGGYTAADYNASRALRDQQAMQMGAANRAAQQQMQARGMGGSGAELAMRMGSADSMAGANSMADAQIQQAAMQRALQSLQGWQGGANTMQAQELARRNALDAFNQSNTDWRRGREQRNTTWSNQGARDRTNAQQQAYENRQGVAAGYSGQYSTDSSNRQSQRNREAQQEQQTVGLIASLLD